MEARREARSFLGSFLTSVKLGTPNQCWLIKPTLALQFKSEKRGTGRGGRDGRRGIPVEA